MLAKRRSYFFLLFLLMFSLGAWLPVAAQVHGVPPSVTSFGFGGSDNPNPGVPASVTSLGPNGFGPALPFLGNCCGNFFVPSSHWQSGLMPPWRPERRHHRHQDDTTFVPIAVPAYIPYAAPYGAYADEDAVDDGEVFAYAPADPTPRAMPVKRPARRGSGNGSSAETGPKESAPVEAAEPVAVQPATVLVFKDGHRSDVINYAIVGDTLFDFAEGRTRKILLADLDLLATTKANDEQGVDFKLPPAAK
jgi:hypothetical protein